MIFVTGGTGLIGSHILYALVTKGEKVKALKRKSSNLENVVKTFSYYCENPEERFAEIDWLDGDILDYFELEKLLSGVEQVYHCAAIVSFNPADRDKIIRNNVEGTANMVNAAIENSVQKFCHVSSVAALGSASDGSWVNEETDWAAAKKITGYAESKFYSETEIWRGIEEGLDAVIVNPSIVLGPGNWDSGSSQLFKRIWKGMKFYTKGITGFVDVRDLVNAMILLMNDDNFKICKNQRYILNADNLSYKSVFFKIADSLDRPRPKYYASKCLLNVAWRASLLFKLITGTKPLITREIATSSNSVKKIDGSKISRILNFEYLPVFSSIEQTCAILKKEMQKL
ncbi:MAG: NAD-dependent epimerase/dehydratase family protein [Prolixibacteraceae bacterium]|nr:NAD-dependent epimerase/dehydratase family protein [Prolixibacteraceae bacterium]